MTHKLICIQVVLQIIYSDTKVSETLLQVDGVLPPEKVHFLTLQYLKERRYLGLRSEMLQGLKGTRFHKFLNLTHLAISGAIVRAPLRSVFSPAKPSCFEFRHLRYN